MMLSSGPPQRDYLSISLDERGQEQHQPQQQPHLHVPASHHLQRTMSTPVLHSSPQSDGAVRFHFLGSVRSPWGGKSPSIRVPHDPDNILTSPLPSGEQPELIFGPGPDHGHPAHEPGHDPPLRADAPEQPFRVFPLMTQPEPPAHDPTSKTQWRIKAHHVLESRWTHMFILGLVLADLGMVLAEIFLELFSFQSCRDHTFEEGGEHWEESERTERATSALRIASLCILGVFCAEIVAKLLVLGPKYYTRHYVHLFDALVIISSFVVTLVLHGPLEEVVALFVMLRLWRIVRVIDSVAVTMEQEHDARRHKLHKRITQLEAQLSELQKQLKDKEMEAGKAAERDGAKPGASSPTTENDVDSGSVITAPAAATTAPAAASSATATERNGANSASSGNGGLGSANTHDFALTSHDVADAASAASAAPASVEPVAAPAAVAPIASTVGTGGIGGDGNRSTSNSVVNSVGGGTSSSSSGSSGSSSSGNDGGGGGEAVAAAASTEEVQQDPSRARHRSSSSGGNSAHRRQSLDAGTEDADAAAADTYVKATT